MSSAPKPYGDVRGPIALDGPVASGKSTVGRRLAARLGWPFIDTGLMYRAVGYLALVRVLPLEEETLVRAIEEADLRMDGPHVLVGGQEIGARLATSAVARAASQVAQLPRVREALVARQRELARGGHVVMAGRDIGTIVLPEAPVKVFLQAPAMERARRRQGDLNAQGLPATHEEVLAELRERDRQDEGRAASPLRPALDAHILQTEGLTVDEVVERVLALAARTRPD
ncbi:MAG: (d)CMP kinase [Chloroflexi bacterium]|nr:(d)CMP kinase [Chloroflexota bacterium]